MQPSPRRLLSPEKVYEGRIWDVVSDSFQLTDDGDALVRDYIEHPGAVAVLPMNDDGEVLLIKQYRHPVGMDLWEIPAGLLDVEGEDFVVGAARELAEEADLVAGRWNVLVGLLQFARLLQRGHPHLPGPRPHRGARTTNSTSAPTRKRKSNCTGSRWTMPSRRCWRDACTTRPPSSESSPPPPPAPTASTDSGRPTRPGLRTPASADVRGHGGREEATAAGGTAAAPRSTRAMTDYLQHMGVERGLAANTLSAYRRDLARYSTYLAGQGVSSPADITRHHVTGFAQALSDGSDGGYRARRALRGADRGGRPRTAQVLGAGRDDADGPRQRRPPANARQTAAQGHQRGRGHQDPGSRRH